MRKPKTRSVSKSGIINIEKPIAGADSIGKLEAVLPAISMNFITRIEFIRPSKSEPVSPINILAGEKL